MKKKQISLTKQKRRIQQISHRSERRRIRLRKKRRRKITNEIENNKKHKKSKNKSYFPKDYKRIKAPKDFSLTDNPDIVIAFFDRLRGFYKRHQKVYVNLEKVVDITCDTICMLLSNMVLFQRKRIEFNGNFPIDEKAREIVKQSGFIERLYLSKNKRFSINNVSSSIYTHAESQSNSDIIEAMIDSCSSFLWNKQLNYPGLYNILIELMSNTYEHADEIEGNQKWWATMSKDKLLQKVTFSFLDYGKGIYKTLTDLDKSKHKGIVNNIMRVLGKDRNHEAIFIKEILQGALVVSETRQDNKGHGLNSIYEDYKEGFIDNLIIITNNVFINVKANVYQSIDRHFNGTFISWEINKNTKYEDLYSNTILS